MAKGNDVLHVRLSRAEFDLSEIDTVAESREMNRTEFVISAIDMSMNFDNDFVETIDRYSKALKMPPAAVIQALVTGWLARDAARTEFYGPLPERVFDEFAYHEVDGEIKPMGFHDLFNYLKSLEIQKLKQKKEERLARRVREKTSLGLPLNEEEQEFSDLVKVRDAAEQEMAKLWQSGKIEMVEGDD